MEMSQSIDQILPEQLDPLINREYNDEGASTIRCMSDAVSFFDQNVGKGSQTNFPMPEEGIANNDAIMVEWFAGWAMTQLENFRKFHIIMAPCGVRPGTRGGIGGGPGPLGAFERQRKDWMRRWSHVRFFFSLYTLVSSLPNPPLPALSSVLPFFIISANFSSPPQPFSFYFLNYLSFLTVSLHGFYFSRSRSF